jgi:hypothetical protein
VSNKPDSDSIWSKVAKPILIILLSGLIGVALWYEFAQPAPSSSQQKPFNPTTMPSPTPTPNSAKSTTDGSELGINADLSR